jgi:hypothetical protein
MVAAADGLGDMAFRLGCAARVGGIGAKAGRNAGNCAYRLWRCQRLCVVARIVWRRLLDSPTGVQSTDGAIAEASMVPPNPEMVTVTFSPAFMRLMLTPFATL